ncbi:hypothetical protein ScPMuIL_008533 [Solemya velum]
MSTSTSPVIPVISLYGKLLCRLMPNLKLIIKAGTIITCGSGLVVDELNSSTAGTHKGKNNYGFRGFGF